MIFQVHLKWPAKATKKFVSDGNKREHRCDVFDKESRERLGRSVSIYRDIAYLNQSELARDIGAPTAIISRLERGVAIPSINRLARIAQVLDVKLSTLFAETELDRDSPQSRRRIARERIDNMLRTRQASDVEDVARIIRSIFEIRRRGERTPGTKGPMRRPSKAKRR